MLGELQLADLIAVHFVGSVGQAQGPGVRIRLRKAEVVADACGAMRLDRPIQDRQAIAGAATLIIAISASRALLPTVSIM